MDVDAFITSVFVKNPLWDQKDSQHHNRFVLDKLWDAVAEEMKTTRSIVRTKWKNLRDTFRKELKKKPVQRSGDEASSWTSSWQYFDSLYFLKDQFTARVSTGNLPETEQNINILDEETNTQLSEHRSEPNKPNLDDSTYADKLPLTNDSSQNKSSLTITPTVNKLKRKNQNDTDVGAALIRLEEQKLRILEKEKKTLDEDDCFFDSLLPHIRPLTPQRKMLLRMRIQELVYNFIYNDQPPSQATQRQSNHQAQNMHDVYEVIVTEKQLRKKWKNLRDQFRKEKKKFPTPRSGDAANETESTWPYFQLMQFLNDDITPEVMTGNLHDSDSDSLNESCHTEEQNDVMTPGREVMKRWKHLRDAFIRSEKNFKQSKAIGSQASKRKKYIFNDELQFLRKIYKERELEESYDNEDEEIAGPSAASVLTEVTEIEDSTKAVVSKAKPPTRQHKKMDDVDLKILRTMEQTEPEKKRQIAIL
ncbi:unnamed protein product [Acanthoscelides obtectus]|uniref:Transcription factor Adf-1 n=1 Tax=Acanthoscelides obtectus TaxID=200917 RepID=A0A9P0KV59_ACAOB|nr:unnamed protein product [Acanthoscelides obtectus]CAK1672070.1 hypothetical protein AOBTE_LOCUS28632 [Acanthoscelides obtectus]